MKDENGNDVTDKELMKEALNHLANAICLLFEAESKELKQFCFVVDSALKLGQVIYRDDDPLDAACDYAEYENKVYLRNKKHLELVK